MFATKDNNRSHKTTSSTHSQLCNRHRSALGAAIIAGSLALTHNALAGGANPGINIDISQPGGISVPSSSYGAASGQQGYWNNVAALSSGTVSLSNLNGGPSGVTLTRTSNGLSNYSCVGGFSAQDYRNLMCDYAFDAAGVVNHIEYEFNGLPGGSYELWTYACRPGEEFVPTFNIGVWVDNVYQGTSFIGGTVLLQSFEEGRTHDIRTVTLSPGDPLRVRVFDSSGEFGDPIALNGLQIVPVGEPTALITSPTLLGCVCSPATITGTANGSGFNSYWLEYSATGGDPWILIKSDDTPVTNGTLGVWNTTGLSEGYYALRLTTSTVNGQTSTAFGMAYVSKDFDTVEAASPVNGGIYGGTVCFDGTVWDACFDQYTVFWTGEGGSDRVEPSMPVYTSAKINELFAQWDTIGQGIADGDYEILITAQTECGQLNRLFLDLEIDNTSPVAEIHSPEPCQRACGLVEIYGTADDANLDSWALQYTGGGMNGWVTIASGNSPVVNDLLAVWDTTELENCPYTLRLIVGDQAVVNCTSLINNHSEAYTTVIIGPLGDVIPDGEVNILDLNAVLGNFNESCR